MLTYNQEKFIVNTIDSILMQKTNFPFQLVIGEDCSTDATSIICEKYANDYGDQIKLLPNLNKNIGLIANYMRTIASCNGKYIAICDGDDYWIDENKLQKQVDFLENNKEYSIVYTNVRRLFPNGEFKEPNVTIRKQDATFDDLIFDNFIPSVTVLFKNMQTETPIPSWIINFPYGDWPTYLWTIKDGGKIHFLDEITAVYRIDIGVSSNIRKFLSNLFKVNIGILECIAKDNTFSHKNKIIAESIFNLKTVLMLSFNRENKYLSSFKEFINIIINYNQKYKVLKLYMYSLHRSFIKRINS